MRGDFGAVLMTDRRQADSAEKDRVGGSGTGLAISLDIEARLGKQGRPGRNVVASNIRRAGLVQRHGDHRQRGVCHIAADAVTADDRDKRSLAHHLSLFVDIRSA